MRIVLSVFRRDEKERGQIDYDHYMTQVQGFLIWPAFICRCCHAFSEGQNVGATTVYLKCDFLSYHSPKMSRLLQLWVDHRLTKILERVQVLLPVKKKATCFLIRVFLGLWTLLLISIFITERAKKLWDFHKVGCIPWSSELFWRQFRRRFHMTVERI